MKSIFLTLIIAMTIVACTTDSPQIKIDTEHLSGYIKPGNTLGLYSDAGLKITQDSIQMTNWPLTKLTTSLENVMDTSLTTTAKITDVYTIQISNKSQLPEREFIDSLIVILSANRLID